MIKRQRRTLSKAVPTIYVFDYCCAEELLFDLYQNRMLTYGGRYGCNDDCA